MSKKLYWGLGVLLILIIGAGGVLLLWDTDTEPAEKIALKPPPEGETFATGHWRGDKWHRTVPKDPETITYNGETLTLYGLYRASYDKSWEERVAIRKRIIAEAPYSRTAYYAREDLATHDENGKSISNDALRFERLKPLLKYYPDSPGLLHDLLQSGMHNHTKAAIEYGKEALKYVDMYRIDSGYGEHPINIHNLLGYAYQIIGDYNTALEHLDQALKPYGATPGGVRGAHSSGYIVRQHIDRIVEGNPILGPLSDGSGLSLPERAPDSN